MKLACARGPRRASARGHTLLEVAIGLGAFTVLLLGTMTATLSAKGALEETVRSSAVASRAQRAIDRVADELSLAGTATLNPTPSAPFAASSFAFAEPSGLVDDDVQWSDATRVELRSDPRDADNGIDDDGDGFVDERSLVLVFHAGMGSEAETVIASDVGELFEGEIANGKDDNGNGLIDEAGFNAVLVTGRLVLRLSLLARDAGGATRAESAETSVRLRN